ncbi:MAG: hypothetical protein ACXU9U_04255 [Parachlamydiaceae bacterium]
MPAYVILCIEQEGPIKLQASQIFVRLLQKRLPAFLTNTAPSAETFTEQLEELKKLSLWIAYRLLSKNG